jgi:Zn-dependent protease
MIVVFYIIVLVFSVIIHEISHGYVALALGDRTAKHAGRLTLNPMKHLDLFGSILLPLILFLAKAPMFGWAKPVPYDPRYLKNPKQAAGLIAAAGPVSNFLLASIFALVVRLVITLPESQTLVAFFLLCNVIIQINIALAFFNLIPIPPLDGSKVLFALLPHRLAWVEDVFSRYGFFILLILLISGAEFLSPLIFNTYEFLVGSQVAAVFR